MANEKQRLLKVKATLRKRQPKFIRQDSHKRSMKAGWRSPKGLHSKIGDNRKGYRKPMRGGYQTPVELRGMDRNGLIVTRVETLIALAALDPKVHSVVISGTLGGRKKLVLIDAAKAKGFAILNASDKTVTRIKDAHATKAKRKSERDAKVKEREAAAKTKESKKKDEEKKAAEKKEEETKTDTKKDEKTAVQQHDHRHEHQHADWHGQHGKKEE